VVRLGQLLNQQVKLITVLQLQIMFILVSEGLGTLAYVTIFNI
jgi:hypothetical protein